MSEPDRRRRGVINGRVLLVAVAAASACVVLACLRHPVHAHEGHTSPLDHFAWLKDLAGACWTGEHPDGKTRDTQCYRVQFDRFIYGTIRISELHRGRWQETFEGDSVLAWDESNQRIAYWFWSNTGAFGPAEALIDGEKIHFPAPRRAGSTAPEVRSSWTRLDADSYRVVRQKHEGNEWKEMFTITYRRTKT